MQRILFDLARILLCPVPPLPNKATWIEIGAMGAKTEQCRCDAGIRKLLPGPSVH
jgi:hypothetical protein